jgi:hypothetical protein
VGAAAWPELVIEQQEEEESHQWLMGSMHWRTALVSVPWLLHKEARDAGCARSGESKQFRACSRGEHLTIEFENLLESDAGKSAGRSHRLLLRKKLLI